MKYVNLKYMGLTGGVLAGLLLGTLGTQSASKAQAATTGTTTTAATEQAPAPTTVAGPNGETYIYNTDGSASIQVPNTDAATSTTYLVPADATTTPTSYTTANYQYTATKQADGSATVTVYPTAAAQTDPTYTGPKTEVSYTIPAAPTTATATAETTPTTSTSVTSTSTIGITAPTTTAGTTTPTSTSTTSTAGTTAPTTSTSTTSTVTTGSTATTAPTTGTSTTTTTGTTAPTTGTSTTTTTGTTAPTTGTSTTSTTGTTTPTTGTTTTPTTGGTSTSVTSTATITVGTGTTTTGDTGTTGTTTGGTTTGTTTPSGPVVLTPILPIYEAPHTDYAGASGITPVFTTDGTNPAPWSSSRDGTLALQSGRLGISQLYQDQYGKVYGKCNVGYYDYYVNADALDFTKGIKTNPIGGYVITTVPSVHGYIDAGLQIYTSLNIPNVGNYAIVDQVAVDPEGKVISYHVTGPYVALTWVPASDVTYIAPKPTTGTTTPTQNDEGSTTTTTPTQNDEGSTTTTTTPTKPTTTTPTKPTTTTPAPAPDLTVYDVPDFWVLLNNGTGNYATIQEPTTPTKTPTPEPAIQLKSVDLPKGTAIYSNYAPLKIYSDPQTTQDTGTTLDTGIGEWAAFDTAMDQSGHITAYELGKNQWVKAEDIQLSQTLGGTFETTTGTTLYSANGTRTGAIKTTGAYKVYAVRYINGEQALKLGTDDQWIMAHTGAYYPA